MAEGLRFQSNRALLCGGMILYERWLTTLDRYRHELAVVDAARAERWTFADLAALADAVPVEEQGSWRGVSLRDGVPNFLAKALSCWRDGAVFCPVEGDAPQVIPPAEVRSGMVHAKLTSGSTGQPRMVLFPGGPLAADCDQIWTTMKLRRDWPNIAVISAAHSYGFANLVLPLLLYGQPMWVCADPLPGTLRTALKAVAGPVTLPAVPALWRAWFQSGVLKGAPIQLAISAGAPLPVELEQAIHGATGIKVHNFYGSSECGGIAYDRTDSPRADGSIAGSAMDGVDLAINEDGCLSVSSAAVASHYWPDDGECDLRAQLSAGTFVSTDKAEITTAGEVKLLGRMTDVINVAGRKVAPAEVEAVLLRHPGVLHCLVFGVPSADADRVQDIVACVNAAPGTGQRELLSAIAGQLASWQRPRHWWLTTDLVPDPRGKISRAVWRRRYLEQA